MPPRNLDVARLRMHNGRLAGARCATVTEVPDQEAAAMDQAAAAHAPIAYGAPEHVAGVHG